MIYILQETFKGFFKNKSMNLITIGIITISIFIFGLFIIGTANLLNVIAIAEDRVQMVAYLKEDITEEQIKDLENKISTILGVQSTEYISKEQALEDFKKDLKEDANLLSAFESNPLPPSIKINISMAFKTPENLKEISDKIKFFDGIDNIDYGAEWINELDRVVKILFLIDVILGIIIVFASIFIVFNTIRLTVLSRKEQIDIMDIIGATETYIETPYIIEGTIYGFLGSLLSTIILYILVEFVSKKIPNIIFMNKNALFFFLFFGTLLGLVGSILSVKQCIYEIREIKKDDSLKRTLRKRSA